MVKRKGIGYIIEAFVASIVIFIFVLGGLSINSEPQRWDDFQDKVAAEDISYVMKTTGYTDKFVSDGNLGNIVTGFSAVSGGKLKVSGTMRNTAVGTHNVGFFAPESEVFKVDLEPVDSSFDRCYNDLEEIDSEYQILRTENSTGSLENIHGARIYVADQDPKDSSGTNGLRDYDTFYVDRGKECQFGSDEGPFIGESVFHWGDGNGSTSDRYYDIRHIKSGAEQLVVYNASLPGAIKEQVKDSERSHNIELIMDSFNFSRSTLSEFDVLVFHGRESVKQLGKNSGKALDFNRDNSIMVASNINHTMLENNAYLNKTGLKWVNMSIEGSGNPYFTGNPDSERIKRYYDMIGCDNCGGFSTPIQGKISSSKGDNYVDSETIFSTPAVTYRSEDWDTQNLSMTEGVSGPLGIPTSACNKPHSSGTFEFPKESGYETYEVYLTKLGTTPTQCDGTKAVSIDLDKDGDVDEDHEGVFTEGSTPVLNQREFNITIVNETAIKFNYTGSEKLEYVNYRESFPEYEIDGFVRTTNLTEAGKLGGDDNEEITLATSLTYWLSGEDREFGETTDASVTTKTVGSFNSKVYIPYSLYLRWSR